MIIEEWTWRCLQCDTYFNDAAYRAYVIEAEDPAGGPMLKDGHVFPNGQMCWPVVVVDLSEAS